MLSFLKNMKFKTERIATFRLQFEKALFQRFKIGSGMFAKRTNEIIGKRFAFINVTSDFANVTFFRGFGLGFYMILIIGIRHSGCIGYNSCLCHRTDKHTMCIKVNILFYL